MQTPSPIKVNKFLVTFGVILFCAGVYSALPSTRPMPFTTMGLVLLGIMTLSSGISINNRRQHESSSDEAGDTESNKSVTPSPTPEDELTITARACKEEANELLDTYLNTKQPLSMDDLTDASNVASYAHVLLADEGQDPKALPKICKTCCRVLLKKEGKTIEETRQARIAWLLLNVDTLNLAFAYLLHENCERTRQDWNEYVQCERELICEDSEHCQKTTT